MTSIGETQFDQAGRAGESFQVTRDTYFDAIDRLETFGVKKDVLADIYHDLTLTPSDESVEIIANWVRLTDIFKTEDDTSVGILQAYDELVPGGYGFGARNEFRTRCKLLLLDSSTDQTISSERLATISQVSLRNCRWALISDSAEADEARWRKEDLILASSRHHDVLAKIKSTEDFLRGPLSSYRGGAAVVELPKTSDYSAIQTISREYDYSSQVERVIRDAIQFLSKPTIDS